MKRSLEETSDIALLVVIYANMPVEPNNSGVRLEEESVNFEDNCEIVKPFLLHFSANYF